MAKLKSIKDPNLTRGELELMGQKFCGNLAHIALIQNKIPEKNYPHIQKEYQEKLVHVMGRIARKEYVDTTQ